MHAKYYPVSLHVIVWVGLCVACKKYWGCLKDIPQLQSQSLTVMLLFAKATECPDCQRNAALSFAALHAWMVMTETNEADMMRRKKFKVRRLRQLAHNVRHSKNCGSCQWHTPQDSAIFAAAE